MEVIMSDEEYVIVLLDLMIQVIGPDHLIDGHFGRRLLIFELPTESVVPSVEIVSRQQVGDCDFLVE